MAAAAQVQELILVDRADPAWYAQHNFQPYSEEDSELVVRAIEIVLASPRNVEHFLVPLAPLDNGIRYYVAIIKDMQRLTLMQYRIHIMGNDMPTRYRAVDVPGSIRAKFPGVLFNSVKTDGYADERLFWSVHRECCVSAFGAFGVARPLPSSGTSIALMLLYARDGGAWLQVETPLLFQKYYSPVLGGMIQTSLCEICTPGVEMSLVMVSNPSKHDHFVAILTKKDSDGKVEEINIVDITVVKSSPDNTTARERKVIFPSNMDTFFPGIRFKSERLSDAEKHVLFQEPVLRYYQTEFFKRHHAPRRLALAMGTHERLSEPSGVVLPRFHLRNLSSDLVAKIAALAL